MPLQTMLSTLWAKLSSAIQINFLSNRNPLVLHTMLVYMPDQGFFFEMIRNNFVT